MRCKSSVVENVPVSSNAIIRRNALDSMPGLQVFGDFGQKWQMEVLCDRRRTQSEMRRIPLKFGFQNCALKFPTLV